MTAADAELDRVVAWLRREAKHVRVTAHKRATISLQYSEAATLYERGKSLDLVADALARHEHREKTDG